MKIPNHIILHDKGDYIIKLWENTADQISMEQGIFIHCVFEYRKNQTLSSVKFVCGQHRFECLNDLRRALKMKAFW